MADETDAAAPSATPDPIAEDTSTVTPEPAEEPVDVDPGAG